MKFATIPSPVRAPRPTLPQPALQPVIFNGWGPRIGQ